MEPFPAQLRSGQLHCTSCAVTRAPHFWLCQIEGWPWCPDTKEVRAEVAQVIHYHKSEAPDRIDVKLHPCQNSAPQHTREASFFLVETDTEDRQPSFPTTAERRRRHRGPRPQLSPSPPSPRVAQPRRDIPLQREAGRRLHRRPSAYPSHSLRWLVPNSFPPPPATRHPAPLRSLSSIRAPPTPRAARPLHGAQQLGLPEGSGGFGAAVCPSCACSSVRCHKRSGEPQLRL